MNFRDCLPLILRVNLNKQSLQIKKRAHFILFSHKFKNIQASVVDDTDNEEIQKCLIEIAEIAPKFLKGILDQVFEFCINVLSTADIAISRKHLALEVIVTLAENASGMVRKNSSKYIPLIGKQFSS